MPWALMKEEENMCDNVITLSELIIFILVFKWRVNISSFPKYVYLLITKVSTNQVSKLTYILNRQ